MIPARGYRSICECPKFSNMAILLGILPLLVLTLVQGYEYPANEYVYSLSRDELIRSEQDHQGSKTNLTQDEQIVDAYLGSLKMAEYWNTEVGGFPPSRPIEEQIAVITESAVYKALLSLPKGGNMHSHENHEVSKRTLLEIVFASPDFPYLWIKSNESSVEPLKLDFFVNPPDDEEWTRLNETGHTVESLYRMGNLISIMDEKAKRYPTDSGQRWKLMNNLWGRGSTQLVANVKIKREHLKALYQQTLDNGAQYIETRKNFGAPEMLYEIDPTGDSEATNGKKFLDNEEGALEVRITKEVLSEFIEENPSFIDHKRIVYSVRILPDMIQEDMQRVMNLRAQFPEHIAGYDMVAEEDQGYALLYHLDNFLSLYDPGTQGSKLPLYLHTAETSWPGDIITHSRPDDPVATIKNAFDAIVLGARRVGHGLGFIKYPYLLEVLKQRGVAVEVCPVSNQLLAFVPDLRNHPAQNYLRSGVPIVLGSDDPGTFGYDHFNIDWYEIFMAWGLNLADMKALAGNSLQYSAMTDKEKEAAFQKFEKAWDDYISKMKTEACDADFTDLVPFLGKLFPSEGALVGTTKLHIFGRNFDRGICKTIQCRFGGDTGISGEAEYISNNHLICEAPALATYYRHQVKVREAGHLQHLLAGAGVVGVEQLMGVMETEVTVEVNLGDGQWRMMDDRFVYKYPPTTDADPRSTTPSAAPSLTLYSHMNLLTLALLYVWSLSF